MKSFLVFLRILIVGCLWGIVFTEGIRVIMLCNWHFDIFWPDHWRQFGTMWKAGWAPHAAKEWAFIILIVTFFPMLITGWWTLSLVAWEEIIWNIIKFPYTLYQKLTGKASAPAMPVNNRYGVVKRKSYKQIRPAGINTLRVPISDYGNTATSAPLSASSFAANSAPFAGTRAAAAAATAPVKKTTDVAATIDHALFKFDDDEDDFDLDIDSFEKTSISKKKPETESKVRKRVDFDDDEDDFERTEFRHRKPVDDDEDNEEEEARPKSRDREREHDRDRDKDRDTRKNRRDEREQRGAKTSRNEETSDKPKKNRASDDKAQSKSSAESTAHSPVYDALVQKNYDVISNVRVGDTVIDYVGVSESDIYLCLVDKESGDWLADEEMFNGEEPLWFSESSHRVSPVCKLHNAYPKIKDALEDEGFEQDVSALVVIQMANIINADDMFDIWSDLNIEVTRINRGAPKEIKLLSKRLPEAEGRVSKKDLDALKKLLKNLK